MKKFSLINTAYFYSFLILILIGATLVSFPTTFVFSAVGDNPTITINSPSPNVVLNENEVVISGTFTDDNEAELLFTAYENDSKIISDSDTNATEWNIVRNETEKIWTFSTTLAEGSHDLSIEIKEKPPAVETMAAKQSIIITINTTRPYISGARVVLSDNTERSGEDFTRVPLDAKIKLTIEDDQQMTQLVNQIDATTNPYNPIKVMMGEAEVPGSTIIEFLGNVSGKYKYNIIFTPSNNPMALKINKTYQVYVKPNLVDDSNNPIFAKTFKFTTMSDMEEADNPHGHYSLNTNMCATCHSTHVGSADSLDGGSYQMTFNKQLKADPSKNYCMACHDGTTNAPMIDKIDSEYHHNNPVDYSETGTNALNKADSCTSCHNPHLEWTEANPNLLKDHYVYTHKETHPEKGLTLKTVDSLDTSCISCHDDNTIFDQSKYPGVFEFLSYKKVLTANGTLSNKLINPIQKTITDYSLCLRCHNSEKMKLNTNLVDIEKHYTDTSSGHYFAIPEGELINVDGSKLDGPMPCAECHETHGSNNIMNLREELGNVRRPDLEKFKTNGKTWSAENERKFCLSCHNNQTEIYGRTGTFKKRDSAGKIISGHQTGDTQGCATCHGGIEQSSIDAAHAPK